MFKPGQSWNDTNGKPIRAHVGGVLFEAGTYYWYGTNFDGPTIPPSTLPGQRFSWYLNRGVTVYSSKDLYNWKYEGSSLAEVEYDPASPFQPLNGVVRPKVIKNKATGKYIMMAGLISPDVDTFNDVIVAVSDSPAGPFEFQGKLQWKGMPNQKGPWASLWEKAKQDAPERIRAFDITLYKDSDEKAYLLTALGDIRIYELSPDYRFAVKCDNMKGVEGEKPAGFKYLTASARNHTFCGPEGEAPAVFKYNGTYYLVTSGLTGWGPNSNVYFTASSLWGPWEPKGSFAGGPKEETTFDSQVTFVLPLADRPGAFIFMADQFHTVSTLEIPDFRKCRHLWLPIELDSKNNTMRVNWRNSWDLSIFDNM